MNLSIAKRLESNVMQHWQILNDITIIPEAKLIIVSTVNFNISDFLTIATFLEFCNQNTAGPKWLSILWSIVYQCNIIIREFY